MDNEIPHLLKALVASFPTPSARRSTCHDYVPLCRGPRPGPQPLSKAKLKKLARKATK